MMDKYPHVTYASGFAVKVSPSNRGADVIHNMITGHLLGGRSLDGVAVERLDNDPEIKGIMERNARMLRRSMEAVKSSINPFMEVKEKSEAPVFNRTKLWELCR